MRLFFMCKSVDTRFDEKRVFGFLLLCKEIKGKWERKAPRQAEDEGEKGLKEITRTIRQDLSRKKRDCSLTHPLKEGKGVKGE